METKNRHLLADIIRFCIVGALSVGIQFLVLVIGVEIFCLNPTLSSAIGFLQGILFNYLSLYYWAFPSNGKHHLVIFRYLLVMSFTMTLNVYVFWVFTEEIKIWYVFSQSIATCCSAFFSFLLNRKYTFV